jgi:carbon-monoxide dehydrogenase medium subunit
VREALPILADVEHQVANVRVRATGTLGGNLCFGEPHSDPATLLLCLDARLLLAGPAGEREVMLPEFVVGPYETALGDGEILKSIMISSPGPRQRAAYVKFQLREYPMLGLALVLDVDVAAEGIREARLAVGSASPTPRRSTAAEALLVGDLRSVAGALDSAADVLADEAELMDDLDGSADYKRHLIHVSLRRLFQRCTNQA